MLHRAGRGRGTERVCRAGIARGLALASVASLALLAGRAAAQSVVEVSGGGSSLLGGYGITTSVWREGVEGWIGLGYLNGFRAGAFVRKGFGRDTLRLGNDALALRYPTDVFSNGYALVVQGASWARTGARTTAMAFGGASSAGLSAPSFLAAKAQAAMAVFLIRHDLSPRLTLTGNAVVAARHTAVPGLEWRPAPGVATALVAGIGAGRPYVASSVALDRGRLGLRASYAWNPDRFRRAAVPAPLQTEVDCENLLLTWRLAPEFSVGVGRQNFVQDSADGRAPIRATGNSAFAGGEIGDVRLSVGLYDSRSDGIRNFSSYVAVGRRLTGWLDAEAFLLQSRPTGRPATTTPIVNLRERLSSRVSLVQQIALQDGDPRVQFGGSLLTSVGEIGVDYQIVHQPFAPFDPFRSAISLTARLQLGRYSTSLGTYVQPDGRVDYAANAGTFLYLGEFGVQPQRIGGGGGIARYVIRGRVVDEAGAPVEGAAIDLGGQIVFSNSRGEFSLRARRPARHALEVKSDDFLFPGAWQVRSAPASVTAATDERAEVVEIVLERR
ncbi:MAG: carboxypeptidase-like regulatory domain-containing protein [Gemmatimonadales bacterium]